MKDFRSVFGHHTDERNPDVQAVCGSAGTLRGMANCRPVADAATRLRPAPTGCSSSRLQAIAAEQMQHHRCIIATPGPCVRTTTTAPGGGRATGERRTHDACVGTPSPYVLSRAGLSRAVGGVKYRARKNTGVLRGPPEECRAARNPHSCAQLRECTRRPDLHHFISSSSRSSSR